MPIKFHTEYVPSNIAFDGPVLVDAKRVRGAFQSVLTYAEIAGLDTDKTIPSTGLVEGMLVYVVESGANYRYTSGTWVQQPSALSNTLTTIQNTAVTGVAWSHNMGYIPTVNVFCNGNQIIPRINHVNTNYVELYFNPPASGTVYVS